MAKSGAQTKADERLAKNVHNWYLDDASARQPREEEWNRSYKRLLPSYVDEAKIKGPFKLKVPYCYRVLEVQTGQVMSQTEANGRWVNARGLTPESAWTGDIVSDLIESQFRYSAADINLDNEMRMETCARLGLGYGNTAGYIEWSTYHKCCTVTALDPYDLFLDWRHNRHYIIRRVVTLGELEEMCRSYSEDVIDENGPPDPETGEPSKVNMGPRDGGKAMAAFKRIYASVKEGRVTGWLHESYAADHSRSRQTNANRVAGSDDGISEGQVTAQEDPYNARVTLLEYHETREDGIVATIVSSGGPEEGVVVRKERQPYGVCQIVPFVPRPVDKEVYGLGIPEVVGHTAEGMDIFYRAGLRWTVRVADPAVLYRKGLRLRQEYLRSQSGISIPVDDTVTDIRYMDVPTSNLHQMAFLFARSVADMGSGESDQRRGQVGGASSATEAAIAEAGSSITDRRIFWRWRRFVQQIARVMLEILKVHVTEEIAVPIIGASRAGSFMRLKPEWLKGRYEVFFGGNTGGMTPVQRQAGFRQIATTYGASGVVDPAALARADLRELGVGDPEAYMAMKDVPENVSPKREHIALFDAAQEIEVSPKNNHEDHIAAHMKEMNRRQGHPALPLLVEHLQIHVQMWQMQQAQAAAQAQPAGAAPMRPEQAGQPGQPASFQPATAGVNEQRQMSNNGTPGRPPGPSVVPNRQVGALAMGGPTR